MPNTIAGRDRAASSSAAHGGMLACRSSVTAAKLILESRMHRDSDDLPARSAFQVRSRSFWWDLTRWMAGEGMVTKGSQQVCKMREVL